MHTEVPQIGADKGFVRYIRQGTSRQLILQRGSLQSPMANTCIYLCGGTHIRAPSLSTFSFIVSVYLVKCLLYKVFITSLPSDFRLDCWFSQREVSVEKEEWSESSATLTKHRRKGTWISTRSAHRNVFADDFFHTSRSSNRNERTHEKKRAREEERVSSP